MTAPQTSIIIPVYNVEKQLDRCLESITGQTLEEIEVILVDDASTDSSPDICDSWALKDERIKVIHKFNEGAGPARNSGLSIAKGKYIGFVDSDDYAEAGMFEALYDAAETYGAEFVMSGVRFVGGNIFSENGNLTVRNFFKKDTVFETDEDIKQLRLGIVGALPDEPEDSRYGMSVWKNLFRRDVIEKNSLSFMSERKIMSEDALFLMDYAGCIKKAVGISGAYYNYCRNEESISKSYKKDRFEKSLVFLGEVEKRLENDFSPDEYKIYLGRFVQSFCRVVCSQEIMYALEKKMKYCELKKRLETICNHEKTVSVLKTYPIAKLPGKQAAFAFAMKHKMYLLQKIMVSLRKG